VLHFHHNIDVTGGDRSSGDDDIAAVAVAGNRDRAAGVPLDVHR